MTIEEIEDEILWRLEHIKYSDYLQYQGCMRLLEECEELLTQLKAIIEELEELEESEYEDE